MPPELVASVFLTAWCGLRPFETFGLRRRNLNHDLQSYLEDGAAPGQTILTISHAFDTWALAPLRIR